MVLIGEKIKLKPVQPEDNQLFAEWFSDPKYLGNFYNIWPFTIEKAQHFTAEGKDSGTIFYGQ
jgi:hypothetical protein